MANKMAVKKFTKFAKVSSERREDTESLEVLRGLEQHM